MLCKTINPYSTLPSLSLHHIQSEESIYYAILLAYGNVSTISYVIKYNCEKKNKSQMLR